MQVQELEALLLSAQRPHEAFARIVATKGEAKSSQLEDAWLGAHGALTASMDRSEVCCRLPFPWVCLWMPALPVAGCHYHKANGDLVSVTRHASLESFADVQVSCVIREGWHQPGSDICMSSRLGSMKCGAMVSTHSGAEAVSAGVRSSLGRQTNPCISFPIQDKTGSEYDQAVHVGRQPEPAWSGICTRES